jgi:hypothetical protein
MRKGAPSLNPSGRPKGIAATAADLRQYILSRTDGGQTLVDGLLALIERRPDSREAKDALVYLAQMVAGTPLRTSAVEMTVGAIEAPRLPSAWESMSSGERLAWIDRERARRALPAGGDDGQE